MRRLLALVLLALALSGCTAGTSDDPAPPNADPNGQQTLPPAGPSSSTTGPPTAINSTSSSASVTTTATPPPPAPRAASFDEHDEEGAATDPDFPSLFVGGRLQGSGPLRIEATANNMGERDYRVPDGACKQPWSDVLRGPGGDVVQHRKPLASCDGFGLKAFAAHDFLSTALAWNGTLWDASGGSFVTAPAGSYTWEVTFDVYSGGSGAEYDDHAALTMSFDVEVE